MEWSWPFGSKHFLSMDISPLLDLEAIGKGFDSVPVDPFVKDGTRHKAIVRVCVQPNGISVGSHEPLYQSAKLNYGVYGAELRPYREMSPELLAHLEPALRVFACLTGVYGQELLVQAQRVVATSGTDGRTGQTVREGYHQDGSNVIGMLVTGRVGIKGGISLLSPTQQGEDLLFAKTLAEGELLIVNDRKVFHNATSIHALKEGGHRDIVLIAAPSFRAPVSVAA